MSRPLVFVVFSYITGILLSCCLAYSTSVAFLGAAFLFVLAVIGYFRFWRENIFVILLLFVMLGAAFGKMAVEKSETPLVNYAGHYVTLTGTVIQDPDIRPDKTYLVLKCQEVQIGKEHKKISGLVRVRVPVELGQTKTGTQAGSTSKNTGAFQLNSDTGSTQGTSFIRSQGGFEGAKRYFSYGDVIKVNGLLNVPKPPGNPGAFDYQAYLLRQGIRVELYARSVIKLSGSSGLNAGGVSGTNSESVSDSTITPDVNPITRSALSFKRILTGIIDTSFTPENAALLKGIMLGERGMIDRETKDTMVRIGTVHLLCVSGFHVGLVMAVMILICRLLRLTSRNMLFLTVPVLIFYALMTGLTPSVMRAATMAVIFLFAHSIGRDRDWPTTLSAAALVILIFNPLSLFNPGFQLSFGATWGILYLAPVLSNVFKFLPSWLEAPLKVTLAAQLGVLPLVAAHYNIISVISLFANIIAVPLVTLIMILGVISVLAGLISTCITTFASPAIELLMDLLLLWGEILSNLPGAVLNTQSPPVFLIALWYAVLFAAGKFILQNDLKQMLQVRISRFYNSRKPLFYLLLGLMIVICFIFIFFCGYAGDGKLIVHFIDVGQGDCALLELPFGKTVLIDAGGRTGELESGTGTGDMVVVPYIRRLGINKIDLLIITHPHEDHAGGVRAVCEEMSVGMVLVPAGGDKNVEDMPYLRLIEDIRNAGIPVIAAGKGDIINLDETIQNEILWPHKSEIETPWFIMENWNNRSLVLRCIYGEVTFLFTGDIEREAQEMLLNTKENISCTVLKVPHHGSADFSPAFIEKVCPRIAVISVGASNRFGHPSAEIIQVLEKIGAKVYRTDEDGAVILETDGKVLKVTTGKDRRGGAPGTGSINNG